MAKKKTAKTQIPASAAPVETISRRGWKTIAGGVASVIVGFAVLTRADPFGRNWAASVCPFLILGGYALMGLGIFLPESSQVSENLSSSQPQVYSGKNR